MSEPACEINLGAVVASLFEGARSLAASLTMDELREEEARLSAVLNALIGEQIEAGRGEEECPDEIIALYDRWVVMSYAIIGKEEEEWTSSAPTA